MRFKRSVAFENDTGRKDNCAGDREPGGFDDEPKVLMVALHIAVDALREVVTSKRRH